MRASGAGISSNIISPSSESSPRCQLHCSAVLLGGVLHCQACALSRIGKQVVLAKQEWEERERESVSQSFAGFSTWRIMKMKCDTCFLLDRDISIYLYMFVSPCSFSSSSWLVRREKLILSITGLSLNTIQVIATIATHRYISKNLAYYLEKDESDYMELGDGSTLESENSDGKKSKGPASLKRLIGKQRSNKRSSLSLSRVATTLPLSKMQIGF